MRRFYCYWPHLKSIEWIVIVASFSKMIGRSVSFFNSCLVRWPLKTQMITGGTLTFLGDVICQNFIENTNKWDYLRSLRMGGFAVCVWSTVGYKWILLAEKWFPGRSAKSLFYKILIDQAIVVPSLLVVFLSTNEILQGHSKEEVFNRFDRDYFDILVKNWSIWTPVQLANFYFIPLIYRNRIS